MEYGPADLVWTLFLLVIMFFIMLLPTKEDDE
jgi:hypothetical protein